MKTLFSLAAGAIVLAAAGASAAQENVNVTGEAEAMCTLPDTWRYVSNSYGAVAGGNFDAGSRTWNIPSNLVAGPDGMAGGGGGEVAIRIRGESFCNAAHTITLESERGGLVADAAAAAGFANRREMRYSAYWSDAPVGSNSGPNSPYGGNSRGVNNWVPSIAGDSTSRTFTIDDSVGPPGYRPFDIRLSLPRGAAQTPSLPLISGDYNDTITVTISGVG
jgi:hypothetical protein